MNKVREILEKIKRHQFWILCGIVALVGILSWWMATGNLAETYNKNKAAIDSYDQKVKSVASAPQHHNDTSISRYKEQTEQTKKQVYDAWQRIYDEQKAKVYVWPTDVLGKDFVDHVTALGPNEEIDLSFRTYYQTRAVNHFKKLAALIEAEYVDPSSQARRTEYGRGPQRTNVSAIYKVDWAAEKFQALQGNYMWPETPTTKQIIYAEEEFWVLTALCEAIREANKDSTGSHNSAVRRIDEMLVAFLAAEEHPLGFGESNRIAKPQMAIKVGEDVAATDPAAIPGAPLTRPERSDLQATSRDSPSYDRPRAAPAAPSLDSDGVAAGPVSVDDALMNWRYVNDKCKPLMGSEVAGQSGEYRLSPWRLTAVVDQRQLDKFLVAFRNTVMPLEIKQVRVNPQETTPMIGPASGQSGYSERRDSYSASQSTLDLGGTVTVELRGVAYLFNPPDKGKIGGGATDPAALDTDAAQ